MRKEDDPSLSLLTSPGHAAAQPGARLDAGQATAPGGGLDARYEQLRHAALHARGEAFPLGVPARAASPGSRCSPGTSPSPPPAAPAWTAPGPVSPPPACPPPPPPPCTAAPCTTSANTALSLAGTGTATARPRPGRHSPPPDAASPPAPRPPRSASARQLRPDHRALPDPLPETAGRGTGRPPGSDTRATPIPVTLRNHGPDGIQDPPHRGAPTLYPRLSSSP